MVLGLAKLEAWLLVRSLLVLAGLLAAGAVLWVLIWPTEPLWWSAAWEIGVGQLVLGLVVLVAAQLAAGRVRRDGLADLYASFPATAGTRTAAQLAGLAGVVPASLLLLGVATGGVVLLGAIGTPSIAVLAGGLLVVIAAGAVGIAIGTRFPHPLAGVLGALVLFIVTSQSNRFSGAVIWLLPWELKQDQLNQLPGPLPGYPPGGAHVAELAGIAVLAAVVALLVTVRGRGVRARGGLAVVAVLAAAVIAAAGVVQLRPIPAAALNRLAVVAANPTPAQRCTTANHVRYCLYPGFGSLRPSLETAVDGVLAHLPALPDHLMTLSQVVSLGLPDSALTHGHPARQVSRWEARLRRSPAAVGGPSAIYLPVGGWPAAGARLGDARFNLALAAAEWMVHLSPSNANALACVPLDQAREAIALWLAIVATHPRVGELENGWPSRGFNGSEVRHTIVAVWTYPGGNAGTLDPFGTLPQDTLAGYRLASKMTSLPEQHVVHVLADGWSRWVNPRTTDPQLAAALGIAMPTVPASPALPGAPRPGVSGAQNSGPGPESPVCTS
jgi:hypothetical protein